MELTPEERQRIYLEEKARIEAGHVPSASNPVPPPPRPYQRKEHTIVRALIICFLIMLACVTLILVAGYIKGDHPAAGIPQPSAHVTYRATGAGMEISYTNGTGGMDHEQASVAFIKAVELPAGSLAYITAQNRYDRGRVMVNIVCNGQEVKRSESNGPYAIATASALCK